MATRCCSPPDISEGLCVEPSIEAEHLGDYIEAMRVKAVAMNVLRDGNVASSGERWKQIETLEDETDLAAAKFGARRIAHFGQIVAVHQTLCRAKPAPSPPITYRSEDFPQPEGPITATDSPGCTSKLTPRSAGTSTLPAW